VQSTIHWGVKLSAAAALLHMGSQPVGRKVVRTAEFVSWSRGLDAELRDKVVGAIERIVDRGPTLGRPDVGTIKGSRLHKLKEARIDRGTRVMFAFDSNRNAVMLLGGDKTGKWNRWYPSKIRQAERLYLDHERSIGREAGWLNRRTAARTTTQRSR
jgi:hypothetical protein